MELEAIAHMLGACDVLGGLGRPDRLRLAGLARLLKQPAGAVIFFQGDPPDALYVVRSGSVRVVHQASDGRELLLTALRPGSAFGEIALLDGAPRTATAVVERATELVRIPRAAFLEAIQRRPELALAVIKVLCARVRASGARVEEGLFLGAEARVARHLLRLAALRGVEEEAGLAIDQRLPQSDIASAVGVSRQTVNQVLQGLQSRGLVRVRRARLTVLDRSGLETAALGQTRS